MAKVEGLDDLMRKLAALPREINPRNGGPLESALRKGASLWVKGARQRLAGKGPGVKNKRTGNIRLAQSIRLRKDPDPQSNNADVRFEVGYRARAFWGGFVELGTSKQPAQPFLRPAFDEAEPVIVRIISDSLREDIERLAK